MSVGTVVDDIDTETGPPPKATGGLADITKGRTKRPRRTMIYGVQGVGKSTLAASADSPVFLPTEEGLNDIDCASFPMVKSFDELMNRLRLLHDESHEFKTIVIDSLDWLERLIWQKVCDENGWSSIEQPGWGKGYKSAVPIWGKLLGGLDMLRDNKGMACILIAHGTVIHYENPEAEGYDRHSPRLQKDAVAYVMEWCDEVLFATYKVYTKPGEKKDQKGNATNYKGIDGGERILRCTEKPFAIAKNRLNMPDEIEMSFPAYKQFQER